MTLEAMIKHIEVEALPIAKEHERETWGQMHEWLLELQWYRSGKPMPENFSKLRHGVMAIGEVHATGVTAPKFFDGVWHLDIESMQHAVYVELHRKKDKPWGVSTVTGNADGMFLGPDNVFDTWEEALAEVKRIVEEEES